MRREKQALSREECSSILHRNSSGVLSLADEKGWPYAVPLNYVFDGKNLYFHCAAQGEKTGILERSSRAVFTVIDQDETVPEKLTSKYLSVIVKGQAEVIPNDEEAREALMHLGRKYSGILGEQAIADHIDQAWEKVRVIRLIPEEATGKMGSQLRKERILQDERMA